MLLSNPTLFTETLSPLNACSRDCNGGLIPEADDIKAGQSVFSRWLIVSLSTGLWEKLIAIISSGGILMSSSNGAFVALWFHVCLRRRRQNKCFISCPATLGADNKGVKQVDWHCDYTTWFFYRVWIHERWVKEPILNLWLVAVGGWTHQPSLALPSGSLVAALAPGARCQHLHPGCFSHMCGQ